MVTLTIILLTFLGTISRVAQRPYSILYCPTLSPPWGCYVYATRDVDRWSTASVRQKSQTGTFGTPILSHHLNCLPSSKVLKMPGKARGQCRRDPVDSVTSSPRVIFYLPVPDVTGLGEVPVWTRPEVKPLNLTFFNKVEKDKRHPCTLRGYFSVNLKKKFFQCREESNYENKHMVSVLCLSLKVFPTLLCRGSEVTTDCLSFTKLDSWSRNPIVWHPFEVHQKFVEVVKVLVLFIGITDINRI